MTDCKSIHMMNKSNYCTEVLQFSLPAELAGNSHESYSEEDIVVVEVIAKSAD